MKNPRFTQRLPLYKVVLFLFIAAALVACTATTSPLRPAPVQSAANLPATQVPSQLAQLPSTPVQQVTSIPAAKAASASTPQPTSEATAPSMEPDPMVQSLPETPVKMDVNLLYGPPDIRENRPGVPIIPKMVPRGSMVTLLGKDESGSWYRVLWSDSGSDYAGWIPVEAAPDFMPSHANLLRAPPPCVKPLAFLRGLNMTWTSTANTDIVIVMDLYRSGLGNEFPPSTFQLLLNGSPVTDRQRPISTRGQYLMRGTPIGLTNLRQGDRLGFVLKTSSQERVKLLATIYSRPDGCTFSDQ